MAQATGTQMKDTKQVAQTEHACPVCRNGLADCGHLYQPPLASFSKTPLDRGVARFAEEVFALLRAAQ